jgi:YfiH family protein
MPVVPAPLNPAVTTRADLGVVGLEHLRTLGVDAFVTTRFGGVSEAPYDTLNLGQHVGDDPSRVDENRRRVAAALDLAPSQLVISRQVHGAVVHDLDEWDGEELVGDAMVSTRDDVALAVLVADCVALLFVAGSGAHVAVAHAGWRGLVEGVIPATLSYFEHPGDVHVVLGPHVSPARYQVGPEVAEHFESIAGACLEDEGDRRRLDLSAIARHQLREAGVALQLVQDLGHNDDSDLFFSDRAQRPCGRFALVVRRTSYHSSVHQETS